MIVCSLPCLPVCGSLLQYLCCEVAHLQQAGRLRQLRVFDIAHMGWRLQTACDMEVAINAYEQVRAVMLGSGAYALGINTPCAVVLVMVGCACCSLQCNVQRLCILADTW